MNLHVIFFQILILKRVYMYISINIYLLYINLHSKRLSCVFNIVPLLVSVHSHIATTG